MAKKTLMSTLNKTLRERKWREEQDMYGIAAEFNAGPRPKLREAQRASVRTRVAYRVHVAAALHCTNVLHNEVTCLRSELPFAQWCKPCKAFTKAKGGKLTLVLCRKHLDAYRASMEPVAVKLTGETFAVALCDHCHPERS